MKEQGLSKAPEGEPEPTITRVPRNVWLLSVGTLLNNVSANLINLLSPIMLLTVFSVGFNVAGPIRAFTESIAHFTKVLSGAASDYTGSRKKFVIFGYSFAVLTKPIFALSAYTHSILTYVCAHSVDRIANGMRDAPRDALIADSSPKQIMGKCYSIRWWFSTFGAVIGSIFYVFLFHITKGNYMKMYWMAMIPIIVMVPVLFGLKDKENINEKKLKKRAEKIFTTSNLKSFDRVFWYLMFVTFAYTVCFLTDFFFLAKARTLMVEYDFLNIFQKSIRTEILSIMTVNILFSGIIISSIIISYVLDRGDKLLFLLVSTFFLAFSYYMISRFDNLLIFIPSVFIYGCSKGLYQACFSYFVVLLSPKGFKGLAFGIFSIIQGVGVLVTGYWAGTIAHRYGLDNVFFVGSILAASTAVIAYPLGKYLKYKKTEY